MFNVSAVLCKGPKRGRGQKLRGLLFSSPKVSQKDFKVMHCERPVATGWLQSSGWPLEGSTTIHLEQCFSSPPKYRSAKATHPRADTELRNLGRSQALPAASLAQAACQLTLLQPHLGDHLSWRPGISPDCALGAL